MLLPEKRLQAVPPGPQGQAGDTAQVRVLGTPCSPVSSSLSWWQHRELGWGGVCTQCCVQQPPNTVTTSQIIPFQGLLLPPPAPGQAGTAAKPCPGVQSQGASNSFLQTHTERQGKGSREAAPTAWGEIQVTCTCLGWITPESKQEHFLLNPG